jgi:hypothetical protein
MKAAKKEPKIQQIEEQFIYAGEKAARKDQIGAAWPVYRDFEVEEKDGDVFVYAPFRPPNPEPGRVYSPSSWLESDLGRKRIYAPLREQSDLFLKFASLARKGGVTQDEALRVMLDWVTTYGVLGLEGIDQLETPYRSQYGGGRRESLQGFVQAVREAAWCLRLYEAAIAPGGPDADTLERSRAFGKTLEEKKEDALRLAHDIVGRQVSRECYPVLYRRFLKETGETDGFFQGWGFRSLLGAMYLQMMWLMTEGSAVRRCKGPGCLRIITFDPPEEPEVDPGLKKNARGKYQTRRDKEFCSRNCKEKWRYHNVIKPRRQSKRS